MNPLSRSGLMLSKVLPGLIAIAGSLLLAQSAMSQTVTLISPPAGVDSVEMQIGGINNSGQVAGLAITDPFPTDGTPFLYTPGSGTVALPVYPRTQVVDVTGLNDAGQVIWSGVGGSDYSDQAAFIYTPGSGTSDIGDISDPHIFNPTGINDSGEISADSLVYTPPGSGTTMGIPGLGGPYLGALAINNAGQVAGYATTDPSTYVPFIYTPGAGSINLGTLGGSYGFAYAINASGEAAGQSTTADGTEQAFLYTPGLGMIDLGDFGGGYSDAYGINASGQVIGDAFTADSDDDAFLYTPGVGMEDLDVVYAGLFTAAGIDPDSISVSGINDEGEIVGVGSPSADEYNTIAFVLDTRTSGSVPDGGMTIALLGGALAGCAAFRRRLAK